MNNLFSIKNRITANVKGKGFPLVFLAFLSGIVLFDLIKFNVFEFTVNVFDFHYLKFAYFGCVFSFLLILSAAFSAFGFVFVPALNLILGFVITGVSDYVISSLIDSGVAAELAAFFALTYLCVFLTIHFSISGIAFSYDLFSRITADKPLRLKFLKTLILFVVYFIALISDFLFIRGIR